MHSATTTTHPGHGHRQAALPGLLLTALLLTGCGNGSTPPASGDDAVRDETALDERGPAEVRIVHGNDGYRLHVDGNPFHVRGAGLGGGSQRTLALAGGNAFRTWRVPADPAEAEALLDEAHENGLMVAMGLAMTAERSGFDYDDADAVAAQRERIRGEVLRHKDHPALLMWVVGNELNLEGSNPAVWDAVNDTATMIHDIDPNHPVMTTLAGFDPALIAGIKARAPALDLLGIQLYGDIEGMPQRLRDAGWDGPYIVTEWGPTGHWESPLTAWGAAVEDHASRKAELLIERYRRDIISDTGRSLGSFAFLWGNKQERTPTWYGLFLPGGEATPGVDALQFLWTGDWPEQRSPSIGAIEVEGGMEGEAGSRSALDSITLAPGAASIARVHAADVNGDPLQYRWHALEESTATSIGGDPEDVPPRIDIAIEDLGDGAIRFSAPSRPGAYRLFVEVHDGSGRATYANLPFQVAGPQLRQPAETAPTNP